MAGKAGTHYRLFGVSAEMPLEMEVPYKEAARILGRKGLVGPPTELLDWQKHGNCTTRDPDLFFPPGAKWNLSDPTHIAQIELARAACAGCLVAGNCLEFAYRSGDPFAIMAGTTPDERADPKLLE